MEVEEHLEVDGSDSLDNQQLNYEEYPDHPLFNSLVLSSIFDISGPSSWPVLRLVCKTWNNAVLHRIREQPVHLLNLNYSQVGSEQNRFTSLYLSIHDPGDTLQFDTYPFRRLILHPNTVLSDIDPFQNDFWVRVGTWLKVLHLGQVTLTKSIFRQLILQLTPNLEEFEYRECTLDGSHLDDVEPNCNYNKQTNLKSVYICMPPGEESDGNSFPIPWMTFFSHIPNLTSLKLEGFNKSTAVETFEAIIDAILTVREANDNKVLNLTELNVRKFIRGNATITAFRLLLGLVDLQQEAVTLKTLPKIIKISNFLRTLALHIKALDGENLSQLLESCPNLINLEMGQTPSAIGRESFRYNSIPKTLQTLDLNGPILNNWEFLRFTPNLTRLNVRLTFDIQVAEFRMPPLKHLKSFHYFTQGPRSLLNNVVDTHFFVEIMPNLEQIGLQADEAVFNTMCTGWPRIKELEISREGIDPNVIATRLASLENVHTVTIIDADAFEQNAGFSANNIRDGFMNIPSLKSLTAKFIQDDVEALRLLRDGIKDTSGCFIKVSAGTPDREYFSKIALAKYLEYVDIQNMTPEEIQDAERERLRQQLEDNSDLSD